MKLPVNYNELQWWERRDVRNEYIRLQKGKCHACGRPLDGPPRQDIAETPINLDLFPPNMLKHPVHLHHDHNTGETIGAVHAHCNCYLWQYQGE